MLLQPEFTYLERLSTESSVDDLGTCRGVVLRRAASILRSIETQPLTGRFVRFVGQSFSKFTTFTGHTGLRHVSTVGVCWADRVERVGGLVPLQC